MQTTYRLKADELTSDLITALQNTYHDREIEITITEVQDETDYLLSSPANRDHLLSAIADAQTGHNLINVSMDSIE